MIERKFVSQNMKEFLVKDYLFKELSRVGLSDVTLHRTPLGEKIVIVASSRLLRINLYQITPTMIIDNINNLGVAITKKDY
jgi:hypothetical protein